MAWYLVGSRLGFGHAVLPKIPRRSTPRAPRIAGLTVAFTIAFFRIWTSGAPLGGAVARAELIHHLLPTLGVGVTDNAASAPTGEGPVADGFATANIVAGAHYQRGRSEHNLDAILMYTRFIEGHAAPTLTAALSWTSLFNLSAVLNLGFNVYAGVSRTSVSVGDLTLAMPTGAAAGESYFFSTVVGQTLAYQPNPHRTYTESISVSQGRYLESTPGLPSTTSIVTGRLRAARIYARDTLFLEILGSDVLTPDTVPAITNPALTTPFAGGQIFSIQAMAGWERLINAVWSTQISAGPMVIFKLDGPVAFAPAAIASVVYHRQPWFGTLTLSQIPAPNLYLGSVTVDDQAVLRLALPLNRTELVFVTGFASYIYARPAEGVTDFRRAFDQQTVGAALTAQAKHLPLAASLQYTLTNQHGGSVAGISAPDLERQTLILTVTGVFSWGPGTLPLFKGGL